MPCFDKNCENCVKSKAVMCKNYHVIDKNKYEKEKYITELILRLNFEIFFGFMNEHELKHKMWLNNRNSRDREHKQWLFFIVSMIVLNGDDIEYLDLKKVLENSRIDQLNFEMILSQTEEFQWKKIIVELAEEHANKSFKESNDKYSDETWKYYNEPVFNIEGIILNANYSFLYHSTYELIYQNLIDELENY